MKLLTIVFATLFSSYSSPSHASLIDHNTFTTDTKTNLSWLDVTATRGLSYYQIANGYGGWLEDGWRIANRQDVTALLQAYVNPTQGLNESGFYTQAKTFIDYFGATDVTQSFDLERIYAMYEDPNLNDQVGRADIFVTGPHNPYTNSGVWYASDNQEQVWSSQKAIGTFLIRAAVVPEPATLILTVLGLGAVFAAKRKAESKFKT